MTINVVAVLKLHVKRHANKILQTFDAIQKEEVSRGYSQITYCKKISNNSTE